MSLRPSRSTGREIEMCLAPVWWRFLCKTNSEFPNLQLEHRVARQPVRRHLADSVCWFACGFSRKGSTWTSPIHRRQSEGHAVEVRTVQPGHCVSAERQLACEQGTVPELLIAGCQLENQLLLPLHLSSRTVQNDASYIERSEVITMAISGRSFWSTNRFFQGISAFGSMVSSFFEGAICSALSSSTSDLKHNTERKFPIYEFLPKKVQDHMAARNTTLFYRWLGIQKIFINFCF